MIINQNQHLALVVGVGLLGNVEKHESNLANNAVVSVNEWLDFLCC